MNERSKYHRLGEPGGPGCNLSTLPILAKNEHGQEVSGKLFSAPKPASELEMLRAIAKHLGVKWGRDELGWWAAVLDN